MPTRKATLALTMAVAASAADPAKDAISRLPGWDGDLPSKQYSGYLDIADNSKHLHYWFVESENDPANDPVVLWLNGGPGCSSLDGFLYEHGPFRLTGDNASPTLVHFDKTWASNANMLYIEAPVGVGFSYADDTADYQCDDDQTANDNRDAVEAFFAGFSDFAKNDFFITGESYAGIYVPTLAEAIVNSTEAGTYTGAPLKGIAVGNGCSGHEIGICGWGNEGTVYLTQYIMQQGFTPKSLKDTLTAECDWDGILAGNDITAKCNAAIDELNALTKDIDTYCIYCDCISGSDADLLGAQQSKIAGAAPVEDGYETKACINSVEASGYLNQASVQSAIHVEAAGVSDWAVCGTPAGWGYTSTRPNLPRDTYPKLVENMRVLIYNGDWDACVPYTDNEAWTEGMGYPVADAWHPWMYTGEHGEQVGGYATKYEVEGGSFSFITVRGGRHEVPETAPEQAFAMLTTFLAGDDF